MAVNWNHIDREEQAIDAALDRGEITQAQANKERLELQRDVRGIIEEEACEAAQHSYLDNGGW